MRRSIIFLDRVYRQCQRQLQSTNRVFCLASHNSNRGCLKLLVREVIPAGEPRRTSVMLRAVREGYSAVQVCRHNIEPSLHQGAKYEAILFFKGNNVGGWIYYSKIKKMYPVDEIRIIGFPLRRRKTTNGQSTDIKPNPKIFDRLIRLMGPESLRDFMNSCFCIVGQGRAGSEVCRKLVRLGAKCAMIVDFDKIELANLICLEGATEKDANEGISKVNFLKKNVKKLLFETKIVPIEKSILDPEALRNVKQTDVLISVPDSTKARVGSNILSVQYLIPLIDAGVTAGRYGEELLGYVQAMIPGRGCLLCREGLALQEAFQEQLSKLERDLAAQRGYGTEEREHAALPTFSALIADYAVIQVLNLFSGFLPFRAFTSFNLFNEENLVRAQEDPPYPGCPLCGQDGLLGRGDLEPLPIGEVNKNGR